MEEHLRDQPILKLTLPSLMMVGSSFAKQLIGNDVYSVDLFDR
jgi:hypothetical protein